MDNKYYQNASNPERDKLFKPCHQQFTDEEMREYQELKSQGYAAQCPKCKRLAFACKCLGEENKVDRGWEKEIAALLFCNNSEHKPHIKDDVPPDEVIVFIRSLLAKARKEGGEEGFRRAVEMIPESAHSTSDCYNFSTKDLKTSLLNSLTKN